MAKSSTSWAKGSPSPNPGGRKRVSADVIEELHKMTPRAIERVRELLESPDERVAMAAAKEVLDRNMGKPMQPTENKHSVEEAPRVVVEFVKAGAK